MFLDALRRRRRHRGPLVTCGCRCQVDGEQPQGFPRSGPSARSPMASCGKPPRWLGKRTPAWGMQRLISRT